MLTPYKLRVDLSDTTLEDVLKCLRDCYAYAYVLEGKMTDNPHVHFYLYTMVKDATLRKRLRNLKLSGNKSYSLKELGEKDPIEYFAYMMKEGTPVWHNIDAKVISDSADYNKKVRDSIKKTKEAKKTILQQLIDIIDAKGDDDWTKVEIMNIVIDFYKKRCVLVREFQLVSLCQTLCLKYVPLYDRELARRLYDRI